MPDLTEEEIKDIKKRQADALEYLKSVNLTPASVIEKVLVGKDTFADRVIPYLRDTRYLSND